jgi:RNA polymerase sigma-70 factor (ECF subfamily)
MDSTHADALRRRETEAWDRFYAQQADELYGFAFRVLRGERAAAEDLFQDVWIEAMQRIDRFDPERGELRTWLYEIARRKVALYWRKRLSTQPAAAVESSNSALNSDDGVLLPEAAIEHVERADAVRAALLVLSPERRKVLTDKYLDGQSVEQIAGRTGKSTKAVESLLSRARDELRSMLRWYFADRAERK